MSELEVQIAPEQQNQEQSNDNNDSDLARVGGDTNSSMQHSDTNSALDSENDHLGSSNAPNSSRGSTRATGEDDSYSLASRSLRGFNGRNLNDYEDELEKEEDGSPRMTNRWFRDLFKKEFKKYYRTPHLNEKLFLHYKGWHYMRNLEQFEDLKCLYIEANGLRSLNGL